MARSPSSPCHACHEPAIIFQPEGLTAGCVVPVPTRRHRRSSRVPLWKVYPLPPCSLDTKKSICVINEQGRLTLAADRPLSPSHWHLPVHPCTSPRRPIPGVFPSRCGLDILDLTYAEGCVQRFLSRGAIHVNDERVKSNKGPAHVALMGSVPDIIMLCPRRQSSEHSVIHHEPETLSFELQ